MKNLKSVLAVVMAICLMLCLAVPVFATGETTEGTAASVESTGANEETTGAAEETTGAAEETTEGTEAHDHDHDDATTTGEAEEESGLRKVIRVIVTVLEVIASVVLVGIVLLQSGKEAGLSGALSGNSDSYLSKMGGGGLDKLLAKSTKWVALAWIVLTLLLSLI